MIEILQLVSDLQLLSTLTYQLHLLPKTLVVKILLDYLKLKLSSILSPLCGLILQFLLLFN